MDHGEFRAGVVLGAVFCLEHGCAPHITYAVVHHIHFRNNQVAHRIEHTVLSHTAADVVKGHVFEKMEHFIQLFRSCSYDAFLLFTGVGESHRF